MPGSRIAAGRVDGLAATDGVGNLTIVPDRFVLAGCDEILGAFPIPASFAVGLPKGFTLAYNDPAEATATMVAIGWKCGKGEIPANATLDRDVALVSGILVTPAAAYKGENAIAHLVLVGYTTANPVLATLLTAWNVSAEEPATRQVTDFIVGGPVRSGPRLEVPREFGRGYQTGAGVALLAGFFVDAPAELCGEVDAHLRAA